MCKPRCPHILLTSLLCAGMVHGQFHHWHDGSAATAVLTCSAPKLYWGSAGALQQGFHAQELTREIWSGADAIVKFSPDPCRVQASSQTCPPLLDCSELCI